MKLVFSSILIILGVALFMVYTDPTYENIKVLRAEEKQFDDAIEKSMELIDIRNSLLGKYNGFSKADLDRVEKLLPDNIDNVRLILDLDGIARSHGVALRNVEVGQTATTDGQADPLGHVTLTFSVSSPYNTFQEFLQDLESSLRLVDVKTISFEAGDDGDVYTYNVILETYWLL